MKQKNKDILDTLRYYKTLPRMAFVDVMYLIYTALKKAVFHFSANLS